MTKIYFRFYNNCEVSVVWDERMIKFTNFAISANLTNNIVQGQQTLIVLHELIDRLICLIVYYDDIGIPYTKDDSTQDLTNLVFNEFNLNPKKIDKSRKQYEVIAKILGNLNQISLNIADLRNQYASGHGKPATFQVLQPRHANLAVLSSFTLIKFIWETFQFYKEKTKNK